MFEIALIICIKMDLVLNNLQRLICHKKTNNQPINTWSCVCILPSFVSQIHSCDLKKVKKLTSQDNELNLLSHLMSLTIQKICNIRAKCRCWEKEPIKIVMIWHLRTQCTPSMLHFVKTTVHSNMKHQTCPLLAGYGL